ncbi:hypothetical protein [Pseudomonas sp. 91RF]|uniref:hypothetical protein n=1 Tax=Pseudomonas sp. 91RF TaxID=2292261 RepID=UPI0021143E0A|nr:hypothetical protein [Pseudomonas sp. 91RF]
MPDKMTDFDLKVVRTVCDFRTFAPAGGIWVQVAGCLGSDLKFGDFQGVIWSALQI